MPKALSRLRAFAGRIDRFTVRRGVIALVNIGVPFVVAVAIGAPRAALLGAVVGMLLSFSDNAGGLLGRLRLLAVSALCLAGGGVLGFELSGHRVAFWIAYVAIVFAVGWLTRYGREPLMVSRQGALAFVVAAAFPALEPMEAMLLAGVVALAALTRALDHALCGPLPLLRAGAAPQAPPGDWGWTRFAFAYAAAGTAALWLGLTLEPTRALWVVATTLVVMQPDARASYRRIVARTFGTFAGVFVAFVITRAGHSVVAIGAAVLVTAALIPHHIAHRYWLHTAVIALLILLLYDLANIGAGDIDTLLIERLKDMLVGCAIALIGTVLAFARPAGGADDNALDGDDAGGL
jgi:hypothetical protein